MSIEKKSLISNRAATKKANLTKVNSTAKVAATKIHPSAVSQAKVSANAVRALKVSANAVKTMVKL